MYYQAYVAHSSLKLRFLPTNPPVRAVLVHAQQGLTKPTPPKETITTQRMASSLPPSQGSICYWVIPTSGSSFTTQLMVSGSVRASNLFPRPGGADSSSAMVIFSTNKEHVGIQLSGSSEYVYGAGSSYRIYQSTFTRMLLHKS